MKIESDAFGSRILFRIWKAVTNINCTNKGQKEDALLKKDIQFVCFYAYCLPHIC